MREFLSVDDMAVSSLFVLGLDEKMSEANTQPTLFYRILMLAQAKI